MKANGYDATMPIVLYQGAILDGWNRYCAATELGLTPTTVEFDGDDGAALEYTLRTNKRRNLTSSQWAAVAVQADELMQSIRDAQPVNQYTRAEVPEQLIAPAKDERSTAHKVAEVFNTNRTYINEAAKLKETSPETFEMVKTLGRVVRNLTSLSSPSAPTKPCPNWLTSRATPSARLSASG